MSALKDLHIISFQVVNVKGIVHFHILYLGLLAHQQ